MEMMCQFEQYYMDILSKGDCERKHILLQQKQDLLKNLEQNIFEIQNTQFRQGPSLPNLERISKSAPNEIESNIKTKNFFFNLY